ncbi:MAG: hypothetical protein HN368_22400, partial [Spirochaetales bacterium]|nr:hypothetical protein [Spirochaetales bacterium]
MELSNIKQPPLNTTLLGVVRGVADYYEMKVSTPMLYGASGHAFLANIHDELCPSGPYCWNIYPFLDLLKNLGIEMKDLGFVHSETPAADRDTIENEMRESLDNGNPCALLNMEFQIIYGYDNDGFLVSQPWGTKDITPSHLSFGSWKEFGAEIHMNFFSLSNAIPAEIGAAIRESLKYAVDLYKRPKFHTEEGYGVGPIAYQKWIKAVKDG